MLLLGLTACRTSDPVGLLNDLTPTRGLDVRTDLAYGELPRQKLDVYALPNLKNAPVVVFIHGGSWRGGSKDEYKFVGASLARAGYVAAVINYRLAPQNRYPDYVRDAALAIRWAHDHASLFGGDPDKLFVMGHSAGGFNAMEAVMNERWLREVGVPISSIRGVIGLAGPYDYDFREGDTRTAFPEGATPNEVMPARHVRADPPPTLLLTAENDTVVGPQNATRMYDALKQAGADVTLTQIPRVNHATLAGALSTRLTFLGPVRADVIDFIEKHP